MNQHPSSTPLRATMHQRVAQTLRYLAGLITQQTALTNAAEGSATLRKRRQDQEHVDEYLQGQLPTFPSGQTQKAKRVAHQGEHL